MIPIYVHQIILIKNRIKLFSQNLGIFHPDAKRHHRSNVTQNSVTNLSILPLRELAEILVSHY